MNQKTAKRLRKIALGMVVAAEQSKSKPELKIARVTYTQDRKTGQVRVKQNTLKGAYKALKIAYRTGALPKNAGVAPTADWGTGSASSIVGQ